MCPSLLDRVRALPIRLADFFNRILMKADSPKIYEDTPRKTSPAARQGEVTPLYDW
jgi:hypothetical protein